MNLNITGFYSSDTIVSCPNKQLPEYAFIGRSNVGKSSLINLIVNQKVAYTSSKPGKTQLINHFYINNKWALVDLPGYGYAKLSKAKRSQMLKETEKYFQKRGVQLVAVFMLIDLRVPPQKTDLERMRWLVENNIYFVRVFTKCDHFSNDQVIKKINHYDSLMLQNNWKKIPKSIISSSKKKKGRQEILEHILELNMLFQNI
tara:strand:- start:1 stop:606 length:606 start_codon:yes stop_codon:yes gene_type:complete